MPCTKPETCAGKLQSKMNLVGYAENKGASKGAPISKPRLWSKLKA